MKIKELLFQNRGLRQTVAKNVFWLSLSQIGSRLIRAAIIIYAARLLGAAEYGVFSYALGLAGFFTIFADIGISKILTREMVQKPKEKNYYFSTAFWIKIFMLVLTAALIIFAAPLFSKIEAAKVLMPFVALIVFFDGLREFSLASFRSFEKMEFEALINIATNVAIASFGFIALYVSATSKSLTLSYAFSTMTGFAIGFIILKEQFKRVFGCFRKNLVRQIFNSAYPMALVSFFGAFMLNTDFIMLGWWRSAEEIGYYSAGQKIIQLLYSLPAILATSTFPALSRFIADKESKKVKTLTEKSLAMVFLIAIPICVGGVILAKPLIQLLYGKEYLGAAAAFQILLFTPLFLFPQLLLGNFILANDKQKKLKLPVALGSIGNVVFNALLIPVYGIVGCAIATVIALFLTIFPSWKIAQNITSFSVFRRLKKIIFAAIIMGIFSYIFSQLGLNVIINIIISVGIYFGALYLMKEEITREIAEALMRIKTIKK